MAWPQAPIAGTSDTVQRVEGKSFGLDNRDWIGVALLCLGAILLAVFQPGYWIGVAGLLVTTIGLAIAVAQIKLARQQIQQAVEVSEATKVAVTRTQAVVARNLLIEAIGAMQRIDGTLFGAVAKKEAPDHIAAQLAEWRDQAYATVALLEGTPWNSQELRDQLVSTAKAAAGLRDKLPEDVDQLAAKTKRLRSDISSTCGLLAIAKATVKLNTEQETD